MTSTVKAGVAAPDITTRPPALLGTFALKRPISGEVMVMITVVVGSILCMDRKLQIGGTGHVMTLTATERMELMHFAQVATRIGGALTVTLAVIAMAHFKVQ